MFIQDVTLEGRNYSKQRWQQADTRNKLYSEIYFNQLRHKLSVQEVREVQMLSRRYSNFSIKAKANLFILDFQSFIEGVQENGESFSTEQWKLADVEFDELGYALKTY